MPTAVEVEPLLPRIARGDRAAVAACLDRYAPLVQSIANGWAGLRTEAEDAVQEIFIELWTHAGRYDPHQAPEAAFVAMIARRKLIARYRKAKSKPPSATLPDELACCTADSPQFEIDDELAPVRRVLAEMPDDQRRLMMMAISEGRTHTEIAGATGLPLGTVKTHIRRGLLAVRERLNGGAS